MWPAPDPTDLHIEIDPADGFYLVVTCRDWMLASCRQFEDASFWLQSTVRNRQARLSE
jgi:hypothetical protein